MEKSHASNKKPSLDTELPLASAPVAFAQADVAAAPKKKRRHFASCTLSHLLLSVLLKRHGVLLLVPLVYFSGMLLFMRNGDDLSHIASTPSSPPLHDCSIFDISPCSPSPAPQASYISYLDFLQILNVTDSTALVFVLHLQSNESGDGKGLRL